MRKRTSLAFIQVEFAAMLTSLLLPVVICGVVLFVLSAISWTMSGIHAADWKKLPNEDAFLEGAKKSSPPIGSFMFPGCAAPDEMKSPEYQKKYAEGPRGVVTFMPPANMGRNLGLTFVYFIVVSFCLAYLGSFSLPRGAEFMLVFRFFATAALLAYLSAIVIHAIWFQCRIVGHVIESIVFALATGLIFAFFWPKS